MADKPDPGSMRKSRVEAIAADLERERQQARREMRLDRPSLKPIMGWEEFNEAHPRHHFIVRGLVTEGSLYALTGFTGHAKTTVALYLALMISQGLGSFVGASDHEVRKQGTTVFVTGENPSNVRDQWLATCLAHGTHPSKEKVVFIPDRFDHEGEMMGLLNMLSEIDDLRLIVVDTLQSFFMGEDDNSNAAMGQFARSWRPVADLPQKPTVLINCHPAGKDAQAAKDNLVPRGGGAFLNEIDANLTVYRASEDITIHWAGKYRGKYPEPIKMKLTDEEFPEIADEDGEPMPMAVLRVTTQASRADEFRELAKNMTIVLHRLDQNLLVGRRSLQEPLGLTRSGCQHVLDEMVSKKLITKDGVGSGYSMTRKGKAELKRIKEQEAEQQF